MGTVTPAPVKTAAAAQIKITVSALPDLSPLPFFLLSVFILPSVLKLTLCSEVLSLLTLAGGAFGTAFAGIAPS